MQMTPTLATIGVCFVTILWGSWFQSIKHIRNFPVDMFISLMYAISVLIVWICILCFGDAMIPAGVFTEIKSNPTLSFIILTCGFLFGIAMQMHLKIVVRIGLILSTSVSATCAIVGGTLVSIIFAGIPEGVSISLIILASFLLICATITCQYAGDIDRQLIKHSSSRLKDILLLAFVNFILMSSYPLANAVGLRTALHPYAFSSLTCMGILVIGACIGSGIIALFHLHTASFSIIKNANISYRKLFTLATLAALCHFGRNIFHAILAPIISIPIATAMGNSYHVWSYVWGLLYGEFKGATRPTYTILAVGVLMFLAGVFILSINVI